MYHCRDSLSKPKVLINCTDIHIPNKKTIIKKSPSKSRRIPNKIKQQVLEKSNHKCANNPFNKII